jgi:multisubunit Na+/H+ antiporter MnhE subunit
MLLWLLFTSTVNASEALAGFGASAIAATTAEVVRANRRFVFSPRLRWMALAWRIPLQILKDTWIVFRVLARHVSGRKRVRGTWQAVPFRHGPEDDPHNAARRALATVATTMSPNTVAVGIDPDRDEILLHQLEASPQDVERLLGQQS